MTPESGFELDGVQYGWHLSDAIRDLQLVDHFTRGMPPDEFFELAEQGSRRAVVLIALIATSVRAKHPDWPVDKIIRTVETLDLSDVEFFGGDDGPPAEAGTPADAENGSSPSTGAGPLSSDVTVPETL